MALGVSVSKMFICLFYVTLQSRDFCYFHFLQFFEKLYIIQFSSNCLDILALCPCICRLDACQILEPETTLVIF